jgi:hypothetical protein
VLGDHVGGVEQFFACTVPPARRRVVAGRIRPVAAVVVTCHPGSPPEPVAGDGAAVDQRGQHVPTSYGRVLVAFAAADRTNIVFR